MEEKIVIKRVRVGTWEIKVQAFAVKTGWILKNNQPKQVWSWKPRYFEVKIEEILSDNKGKIWTDRKAPETAVNCSWSQQYPYQKDFGNVGNDFQ